MSNNPAFQLAEAASTLKMVDAFRHELHFKVEAVLKPLTRTVSSLFRSLFPENTFQLLQHGGGRLARRQWDRAPERLAEVAHIFILLIPSQSGLNHLKHRVVNRLIERFFFIHHCSSPL